MVQDGIFFGTQGVCAYVVYRKNDKSVQKSDGFDIHPIFLRLFCLFYITGLLLLFESHRCSCAVIESLISFVCGRFGTHL